MRGKCTLLDSIDIAILLTLQNDPLITISDIAHQIDMSISNTVIRVKRLIEEEKAFSNVHIDLNLTSLGLEIHDYFFHVDTKKSLEILEKKFCIKHPYVLYRARCNGNYPGIYIQYRSPKNSKSYLDEIAQKLAQKNLIKNYEYVERDPNEHPVRIKSSLHYWDYKNNKWIFDWSAWQNGFSQANSDIHLNNNHTKFILPELSEFDVKLLAQLSMDARRKNVDIIKEINKENDCGISQKVSRRLKFLKENTILDYRIFLNWATFDLYQTMVIRGYCDIELARKLRNYLNSKNIHERKIIHFPFDSLYFVTTDGFFWYVRAPPSQSSELLDFIWSISPVHKLFFIDYRYSQTYGLWAETFDVKNNNWKLNKEFMINNVLENL